MVRRSVSPLLALLVVASAACGATSAAGSAGTSTEPTATVVAGPRAPVDVTPVSPSPGDGPAASPTNPGRSPAPPPETVTVAGDSISVALGAEMQRLAGDGVTVEVIGVQGSGLAFPNALDWPARIAELVATDAPDVVVFSVGSNDATDLVSPDGEVVVHRIHDGWAEEYSRRLAAVFDAVAGTGTELWWVGQVCAARAEVCETNRAVHRLAVELASDRGWVRVYDLAALFGVGDGPAVDCLAADGVHLDADCVTAAAQLILGPGVPAAG